MADGVVEVVAVVFDARVPDVVVAALRNASRMCSSAFVSSLPWRCFPPVVLPLALTSIVLSAM